MNNKYSPPVVTGFAAAALSTIPLLKGMPMYLLVPLAVYFTLTIHFKLYGMYKIPTSRAIFFGFLTGLSTALFSTAFDTLSTFITRSNDLINNFGDMESMFRSLFAGQDIEKLMAPLKSMRAQIQSSGFSMLYVFSMFFGYLFIDVFMGLVGGALLTSVFHKKFYERS
jgi:hypothetical protein